ncbi:hypothetical protein CEXT_710041 [Caerostris extrusa]|uniref:Uncharacterized protein n=1 Tax=Caerostris extrusa TaxID=172846 RepID=A0AAV4VTK6_CAEEX|nr:hypothetical protein CEXT_710041 [Caerostris extrusa]
MGILKNVYQIMKSVQMFYHDRRPNKQKRPSEFIYRTLIWTLTSGFRHRAPYKQKRRSKPKQRRSDSYDKNGIPRDRFFLSFPRKVYSYDDGKRDGRKGGERIVYSHDDGKRGGRGGGGGVNLKDSGTSSECVTFEIERDDSSNNLQCSID